MQTLEKWRLTCDATLPQPLAGTLTPASASESAGLLTGERPQMLRAVRRISAVVIFSLLLQAGAEVTPGGTFPLDWLNVRFSFGDAALAYAGVPKQTMGSGHDRGHHAPNKNQREQPTTPPRPQWAPGGENSFNPATSKRLAESSGRGANVYENTDGSITVRYTQGAVNYRDRNGRWQPIDSRLVNQAGRWAVAANDVQISVAARGLATQDLATVKLTGGQSLSYGLHGTKDVTATIAGQTASYPDALPNVDVQLSALANGVKETLVLKNRSAAREFVFPLNLTGLTPRLTAAGHVELLDVQGKVAMEIPRPWMEDSAPVNERGERPKSYDARYELTTLDGRPALKLIMGTAWLDDPKRVWPVYLDPTTLVRYSGDYADVYVDNESDTHAEDQNGTSLAVGRHSGGIARSFLSFDQFDNGGFLGKKISAAKLHLFHTWSNTCSSTDVFNVHRVTSAWSVAGLSDAGLASPPAPSYTSPIGSLKITDHSPACTNTGGNRTVGQWHAVTLDPTTFRDWATNRGSSPALGLALTAPENVTTSWKRFTSANLGESTCGTEYCRPSLELTYTENEKPQVNNLFPPSGTQVSSLRPQLIADVYDSDGFPATLEYNFEIFNAEDDKNQVKIAESNWQTSKSWTVPAGVLKWGGRYRWHVTAHDGRSNNGKPSFPWQPDWRFVLTTPVPQAVITSTLGSNGPAGFQAGSGSYTTAAVDAKVETVGPPLAIQRSYHSLDPRTSGAFGEGWTSVLDMNAVEQHDSTGAVVAVTVTYPTGQQVSFGRNDDGSFSPGLGRASVFKTVTGGYQLTDKDGTSYLFTAGSGAVGLTSITDAQGNALTLTYTGTKVTKLTAASGRNLHIEWGANNRIAKVTTDLVTASDPNSALAWTYAYNGNQLVKVCSPASDVKCTQYSYVDANLYPSTVENLDPYSYWRLGEASGPAALSNVLERAGTDVGTYSEVALGQPGKLAGTAATAAGFNGTSSHVSLPAKLESQSGYQAISMWFKTSTATDQVLFGQSWDPITATATSGLYQPLLYVGSDGKLVGGYPIAPQPGPLGSLLGYGSGRCVDASNTANMSLVHLYDCHGGGNQQWTLTATGELRFTHSGVTKCMDASGTEDLSNVVVYDCHGGANQKWMLSAEGRVKSHTSGLCLDTTGVDNATRLVVHTCHDQHSKSQTFAARTHNPMQSAASVADGQWHHVVLTAAGDRQAIYVDNVKVAEQTGIIVSDIAARHQYIGAGFLGGGWPNQSHPDTNKNTGVPDWFSGSISDVAIFDRPLTTAMIGSLYGSTEPRKVLSQINRPGGGISAKITYDSVSGRAKEVTDANGGVWKLHTPEVKGSSQVYASSLLGAAPIDYWRLNDLPGITQAYNEINGSVITNNNAVLGSADQKPNGPFTDTFAPTFDGTSAYFEADGSSIDTTKSYTVSAWVFLTKSGVYQTAVAADGNNISQFYLGYDAANKWRFAVCPTDSTSTSTCTQVAHNAPELNKWTHLTGTYDAGSKAIKLYVNGTSAGSATIATPWRATGPLSVGASKWSGARSAFWSGRIAEVATFRTALTQQQIWAQYLAADKVTNDPNATAMPSKSVSMTHPDGNISVQQFNLYSGQPIAVYDALGYKSQYGYHPTSGLLSTVTDPNGNLAEFTYDVRGNMLTRKTCLDRLANVCGTERFTYFPDATTKTPAADPRNDVMLTYKDGRTPEPGTDNTYLTTFTYDTKGNPVELTDPLGRKTLATFSDGTSGIPSGLPLTESSQGGATATHTYNAAGDLTRTVDAAGMITEFTYDGLGRVSSRKLTSGIYPGGLTTTVSYNKHGLPEQTTEPAVTNRVTGAVHTRVTTVLYNEDGQPLSMAVQDSSGGDAERKTLYGYNGLGQRSSMTDASGKVTGYTYDLLGQRRTQTDPAGTVLETVTDTTGKSVSKVFKNYTGDPDFPTAPVDVTVAANYYDPAGRLIRVTDSMGWDTEYEYTDNNLLKKTTRTNGTDRFVLEDNSYDLAGNLVKQVTNNGATVQAYAVDAASRVTSTTLDPNGLKRTTSITYSPEDLVNAVTIKDGAGNVASQQETAYDKLGRVLAKTTYTGAGATPIARWKLNGDGADATGNSPGTTSNVTWSPEKGGSGIFNGTTSVTQAAAVADVQNSVTVSAWVKLEAKGASRFAVVMPGVLGSSALKLGYDSTLDKWLAAMAIREPGKSTNTWVPAPMSAAGAPQVNVWTHLAVTVDTAAKTLKLYVNGVQAGSSTTTLPFTNQATATHIGGDAGQRWQGGIADVQVYQKALSSGEISQVYAGAAQEQNWGTYRDYTSGDGDKDGKADLLAIRSADNTLVRWSGNGDGTFTYGGTVNGGWSGFRDLMSVDFNRDGWLDLLAVRTSDHTMQWFKGTGAWTYAAGVTVGTGWSTDTKLTAADFNADGKTDVMSVRSTDGVLRFYFGDGIGGFNGNDSYGGGNQTYTNRMSGDFNGDGKTDMMAVHSNGELHFWSGNGGVSFGAMAVIQSGWTGLSEATSGDFNGDGRLDAYAVRSSDGALVRRHRTLPAPEPHGVAFTNIGDLASVSGSYPNPANKVIRESFVRDESGVAKKTIDPNGNVTHISYDEAGRPVSVTAPSITSEVHGTSPVTLVPISSAGYDTFGSMTQTRNPVGEVVTRTYDAMSRVKTVTYPSYTPPGASTPVVPSVQYGYNENTGDLTSVTDPLGNMTSQAYDIFGRLTKQTNADAGVSRYTYSLNGDLLSAVDPTGAERRATWDYLGRQVTATEIVRQTSSNHTTTFGYAVNGLLSSKTSPDGVRIEVTHNTLGEIASTKDAGGAVATYTYDAAGRLLKSLLADGTSTVDAYDLSGRMQARKWFSNTNALLRTVSAGYDRNGNLVSSTDGRGTTKTFTYDALNRLMSQVEPTSVTESITSTFGYDAAGRRTRFTNGRGNATWTTYNTLGLPESIVEPGDHRFTSVYDKAGQLVEERIPGGVTVNHTYDEMGLLRRSAGSGAEAATEDRVFGYDKAGRVTSLSGPGGTNTLTWDDRGLLRSVAGPSGNNTFTYTGDGLMKTRQDAAGTTTYGYDTAGRLGTVSNPDTGVQMTLGYDALSQLKQITHGSGGNTRWLGYDPLHRLSSDELKTPAGASIAKLAYGYDANDNLTSKTTTGFAGAASNTYGYDLANRLISWSNGSTSTAYAYDKAGNRTQAGAVTYTFNERDQLASNSDGTTYEYTARGTLRRTTVGTVSLNTLADAFGQITSQESAPGVAAQYTYDGLGRAIKPGFAYTGLGNDLATDGDAKYTRDPGGGLLGVRQGTNNTYAWTDLHTDVVGQFTATGASLSGSQAFDPYGKPLTSNGVLGSLGYQQEYTEASTGRVNMHARWYQPGTGAFDSRDSVTLSPNPESANANRYGYANANPMTGIDPTGHWRMKNCNDVFGCVIQGFVNEIIDTIDIPKMARDLWSAISNFRQTIKSIQDGLKHQASVWKGKLQGWLKGKCPFYLPCDLAAEIGGWICAISGLCEIVEDCTGGNKNKCAEHVGQALAGVLMTIVDIFTGGATFAIKLLKKVAERALELVKKFKLPRDRLKDDPDRPEYIDPDGNIEFEKWCMANPKKCHGGDGPGGNGGGNGGGGNGGGGGGNGGGGKPKPKPKPKPRPTANDIDKNAPKERPHEGTLESCFTHSFDPDTKVLMADGTWRAIKEVQVGDKVTATDPETGKTTSEQVTVLHENFDTELTNVTVSTAAAGGVEPSETAEGKGGRSTRGPTESVIETTAHHPFWDVTAKAWVNAADLKPGQSAFIGPEGQTLHVVKVDNFTGNEQMRDLTVANVHTYYIQAANEPALVHNNNPCPEAVRTSTLSDKELERPSFTYQAHATGTKTETTWRYNDELTEVDGDADDWLLEAKWTGNENQWGSSNFNPNHRHFDGTKILDQARRLLDLAAGLDRKGVEYRVSSKDGADFFRSYLGGFFEDNIKNGTLRVVHVPGDGMWGDRKRKR
ncbi:LamG-like jellyroll fold domain-containing protein [Catelliglobosispora koreensis]|uniref:LamG-like jellyroll fold domain-containing protein n=1 Tax=Catelliglobosispora koreensis TaxID=129052 RepID=UPI00146AEBE7|nr:LamG-like jellyroll fold domain-containing protein [Catelliglobosispora koreensis]